jgi:hypothetical protein
MAGTYHDNIERLLVSGNRPDYLRSSPILRTRQFSCRVDAVDERSHFRLGGEWKFITNSSLPTPIRWLCYSYQNGNYHLYCDFKRNYFNSRLAQSFPNVAVHMFATAVSINIFKLSTMERDCHAMILTRYTELWRIRVFTEWHIPISPCVSWREIHMHRFELPCIE